MRTPQILTALLLVAAVAGGVVLERFVVAPAGENPAPAGAAAATQYVCPMHPEVVRTAPGTCPICGMQLVAAAAATPAGLPEVAVSAAVVNSLGVRTARVQRTTLWREARVPAYVQGYTAGGSQALRAPFAGQVVKLHTAAGKQARRGEPLFEMASDVLAEAQAQHLHALAANDPEHSNKTRRKLHELALAPADIERLERTRTAIAALTMPAPVDGRVAAIEVRAGDAVERNAVVLSIETAGEVAVDVDLFRSQLMWVKSGDRAELRLAHAPNRAWRGTVMREGVQVSPQKRTYIVRLHVPIAPGLVFGNMTGEVRIFGDPHYQALAIPREALIRGEHGERAVLALGGGRFRPVAVAAGIESGDAVEIVSGLREGDAVVTSAQFLLDSESSLRAEFLRMGDAPAHDAGKTHDHAH
ncbi:MAG: hypothetical protein A2V91_06355 [Candidatus Muproteobacteria bacterium RBG_16_64_10]|uniref:Uncharacterized protein n=1 Tax=Candidatus Muproteobacteria bacterium RBG_16_64_10 TaxID=1817757 RepID=A0A1F6T6T2_9PROT|nr:MAG: hypothetical protein A2V91_06355 [Candidatus Muproteobacteria bacterium RBG_16_64_10]